MAADCCDAVLPVATKTALFASIAGAGHLLGLGKRALRQDGAACLETIAAGVEAQVSGHAGGALARGKQARAIASNDLLAQAIASAAVASLGDTSGNAARHDGSIDEFVARGVSLLQQCVVGTDSGVTAAAVDEQSAAPEASAAGSQFIIEFSLFSGVFRGGNLVVLASESARHLLGPAWRRAWASTARLLALAMNLGRDPAVPRSAWYLALAASVLLVRCLSAGAGLAQRLALHVALVATRSLARGIINLPAAGPHPVADRVAMVRLVLAVCGPVAPDRDPAGRGAAAAKSLEKGENLPLSDAPWLWAATAASKHWREQSSMSPGDASCTSPRALQSSLAGALSSLAVLLPGA